ncbi:MAG: TIGR01212 family radical SAM protein [Sulfurospirillaceae bacterium]|nr:TIGR01212 family radical SAM protein [Sulfurospirillaceae bacterium]
MRDILTAGRYFRKKFGCSVYKIPISISGFTCPNIDGSVARGGCVFCENESFSPNLNSKKGQKFTLSPSSKHNPFLEMQLSQLESQYKHTKAILSHKFKAKKFIIYFQSFTNTYAPLETLKALYQKALRFEDVVGLSIGTRTDSVSLEVLEYLSCLAQSKEVWVEYGIQSAFDETLQRINRGHDVENIIKYINLTRKYGLKVCAHLIFGLPKETKDMMLQSVKMAISLGVESLKIHPLYVVQKTALANDFVKGSFEPITQEMYIETLVEAFKIIPETTIVQRVSAGVSNQTLLSPKWCDDKHTQMKNIRIALKNSGLNY